MPLPLHGKINPINFFVEGFSVFGAAFSSQAPLGSSALQHVVVNHIWLQMYLLSLLFIIPFAVMLQLRHRSHCAGCGAYRQLMRASDSGG